MANRNYIILEDKDGKEVLPVTDGNGVFVEGGTKKLENKLTEIDSKTTELNEQLDNINNKVIENDEDILNVDRFMYSNWGTIFDNKISHNSWTHGTTFYDNTNDVVVVAYNAKDYHAVNNASVYLRYMNKSYEWSKEIVVKEKETNGVLCHTAFSINGKWHFIIQTINNDNTTSKIELYSSIDFGTTWTIQTITGFDLNDIYAGDIYGNFIDNGKLFVTCYNNNTLKSYVYTSNNYTHFVRCDWIDTGETNISEPMFVKDEKSGRIACFARYGVDDRYDITIPARYFYSDDGGNTWTLPVESKAIPYMNNNNGTILPTGNGNCEIVWGNRRSLGWSEIWHGNCKISNLVNDKPFNVSIVCNFNKITGTGTNLGDGGYVGACVKSDGEIVGSYYTGQKNSSNICIFFGSRGAVRTCPWEVDPTSGWSKLKKSLDSNYVITSYNTVIYNGFADIPISNGSDLGTKTVSLDLDKIPWRPSRLVRATTTPTQNTSTGWDNPKFICGINSYNPNNNTYELYVRTMDKVTTESIARVWFSLEVV